MDFKKLKECLNKLVDVYKTPGVDCIVLKEHEELFRYYTGYSDIENNIKTNGNELYSIFSLSKLLTCTAVLQLFEKGKFSMEDKLSKYFPEFENMMISKEVVDSADSAYITNGAVHGGNKTIEETAQKSDIYANNPITIKDLLTMSAGLDYNKKAPAINECVAKGKVSTREIVGALSETVLSFEPGTGFRYSMCHDVLGALVEVWSGMRFGEYLKKNIFDVIGMKDTFMGYPKNDEQLSRMAVRYTYDASRNIKRLPDKYETFITKEFESGGSGIVSSTQDYSLFVDALACGGVAKNGNRVLSASSVELMRTNQLKGKQLEDFDTLLTSKNGGYGYGFGVRTNIVPAKNCIGENIYEFGWDGAAGAFTMVIPKYKLSLTYFQEIHAWDLGMRDMLRDALYNCFEESDKI